MRYLCSKFCLCLCLSLVAVGCTASRNPEPVSALKSSPVESEVASDLYETPSQSAEISVPASAEEALWTKLMDADEETYVVLLRHAIAPGTGDPANFQLDDCSTQRNLSDEGRQQARDIGKALRDRNIPVTKVLSSQWCRCLKTAELMNIAPVEAFPPLNSFFRDRNTAETQTAQVKDYIAASEDAGVIIMVTHQVNITALSDIFPPSGSAVVIQPRKDQLEIIGQLFAESS